tara:strand:- start:9 stop:464 length:456 start_codon:yes stop_codon:yes gene_type:complete
MINIQFKTFKHDDFYKDEKIEQNIKIYNMYLHRLINAKSTESLKSIYNNEKVEKMINEYIFELVGTDNIQYYKTGTKLTERCLWDDKPQGYSKKQNREYIQQLLANTLCGLNSGLDFMNDWIYQNIIDELQIKDDHAYDYIEGEVIVYTPP